MAVSTIDLPVIGKTKTTWVYVAGAGIVGFVGYAWWTKGGAPAPSGQPNNLLYDEFGNPIGVSADEYVPPTVTGGGQVIDSERPPVPVSNSEWTLLATDHLTRNGFEPIAVGIALGKFLTRQTLTTTEMGIVQAAVAAFGQPPVGGPWPIQQALPPTSPPAAWGRTGKVRSVTLRASGRPGKPVYTVSWPSVPGAVKYRYRWQTGATSGGFIETTGTSARQTWRISRGTLFHVNVIAVNAAGQHSVGTLSNRVRALG